MVLQILLGLLLATIVFLTVLALAGSPGGFWVLGTIGVQCLLVILGIIGVIGVLDMMGGVMILGGTAGAGLIVLPLLH